jgi:hypothetical protein
MWTAGGCARRCDSQVEQISGGPCLCPHAEDPSDAEEAARAALRRADMARKNPPQACHLITRVNVMIPDLPGLGVFRLDTSSYYAAVEIGDAAMLMQAARDQGVFLSAVLRIDQRQRVAGGQTKKYPVPVLEITSTFRQIVSGELAAGGVAAQLPPVPGTGRQRAITAAAGTPPEPGNSAQPPADDQQAAQEIADAAGSALTRDAVRSLIGKAKAMHLEAEMVCVGGVWMTLKDALTDAWNLTADGES